MNPADYVPGEIPEGGNPVPASVWAPGDVHHTYDQIAAEAPAGTIPVDPNIARIQELEAELAAVKGTEEAPAPA